MNTTTTAIRTRTLILCAIFAALTAVCSQIQIPLPMVPINLALFAVHMAGATLGPKYGSLSMGCYMLLALVGVPVLSGFTGGAGVLFGKTGGYVLGYLISALVTGLVVRRWGKTWPALILGMAAGVLSCYFFGTVWFMILTKMDLLTSLAYCVIPFLAGDVVKILLAAFLVKALDKPLRRGGWAVE